jgi:hypothetical protein
MTRRRQQFRRVEAPGATLTRISTFQMSAVAFGTLTRCRDSKEFPPSC